jgi:hypothetical protein
MRAIAVKTTRTLNPNQVCAFSDLRTSLCERNTKSFAHGKSATKSLAIASSGRAAMGSPGKATIIAVSRAFFFLDMRARAPASSQGSTSDRASAERTLSGCPCRSSPIEAKRNESNSRPIRGAGAACVISSIHSLPGRSRIANCQSDHKNRGCASASALSLARPNGRGPFPFRSHRLFDGGRSARRGLGTFRRSLVGARSAKPLTAAGRAKSAAAAKSTKVVRPLGF